MNYYQGLAADYSRPGLVPTAMRQQLIASGQAFAALKEAQLPAIGPAYTQAEVESENRAWWPTHCEALRQGRGDILTAEYRDELVYFCQDGPFYGIREQAARERDWWALLTQPGVTMCWPIVMFWSEFVHFEWKCVDDVSNETVAKGSVCWVRRGHRGGCYFKSEQLTFYRNVSASPELLARIQSSSGGTQ